MKTNDITVCAFPKSGITYLGFLLTAARLKHNGIDLRPTFYNIDWLLIDSHKMGGLFPPPLPMWRDGIGELYKTHAALTGDLATVRAPPQVIYLLRNPVDTLASYFHFRRQLGMTETLKTWLETGAIEEWKTHVRSWLIDNHNASQSLYLVHYEDLISEPIDQLRQLAHVLGLAFKDETLTYAAGMSDIDVMRGNEHAFSARNPVYARFNLEFVRSGEKRRLTEMTPELVELIERKTRDTYDAARGHT